MKFGPSRGNPLIIFEHFFKDFGLLILAVLITIWQGPEFLMKNAQIFILVIINPIGALIKYFFTRYSIDDEKMTIDSGLFVKKKMEIPIKAITTVDLSQNLLFQLFHVWKIKADNSSQTNDNAKQAEIVLVLKQDSAYYVKNLLESKNTISSDESINKNEVEYIMPTITCTISDFVLLGALQSKLLYFITIVSTVCGGGGYLYSALSEQLKLEKILEKFLNVLSPVVGISILVIVAYLISIITSVVLTAVRYYNYTVSNRDDALLVKYGLFTKKSYTLKKEKISGITIKQSLLMRILGYCSVEVFIIGYGDKSEDNQQELSLLYPIAKLNNVNSILEQLLPDMTFSRTYHKKVKGSLRYFFYSFRIVLATGLLLGTFATVLITKLTVYLPIILTACFVFLAFMIVSVYLEYCNSGIHVNQKVVSIRKGIINLSMVYIKTQKLESLSEHTSIWKRKKGFTNMKIGFIAPLRVSHINVRNITYQDYQEVQNVISF